MATIIYILHLFEKSIIAWSEVCCQPSLILVTINAKIRFRFTRVDLDTIYNAEISNQSISRMVDSINNQSCPAKQFPKFRWSAVLFFRPIIFTVLQICSSLQGMLCDELRNDIKLFAPNLTVYPSSVISVPLSEGTDFDQIWYAGVFG